MTIDKGCLTNAGRRDMSERRRFDRIFAVVKAGGTKGTMTAKVIAADAMIWVICVLGISEFNVGYSQ